MNILITGIHGFVGGNIVAALKNHHTIYGLDIVSPQKDGVVETFGWNELGNIPTIDCRASLITYFSCSENGQIIHVRL